MKKKIGNSMHWILSCQNKIVENILLKVKNKLYSWVQWPFAKESQSWEISIKNMTQRENCRGWQWRKWSDTIPKWLCPRSHVLGTFKRKLSGLRGWQHLAESCASFSPWRIILESSQNVWCICRYLETCLQWKLWWLHERSG